MIPGKVWVQIQESLERNKSKSFRKPRSNEALLTGLLFCSCGERMYPKMSKRKTADGKVIYTYVCKMKERSQRSVCNSKNANGNTLDMAVVEQIKMLAEDKDTFIAQLEQSRRFYTGNRMDYEQRLDDMRKEKAETEKKINSLVDSLVDMGDSPAKAHVTKRIEQLNGEYQSLESCVRWSGMVSMLMSFCLVLGMMKLSIRKLLPLDLIIPKMMRKPRNWWTSPM